MPILNVCAFRFPGLRFFDKYYWEAANIRKVSAEHYSTSTTRWPGFVSVINTVATVVGVSALSA